MLLAELAASLELSDNNTPKFLIILFFKSFDIFCFSSLFSESLIFLIIFTIATIDPSLKRILISSLLIFEYLL